MWCRRPFAACTGPGTAFLTTPTLSVTCGHRCSTAPGSALRSAKRVPRPLAVPATASAEAAVLAGEERRETVAALRRLPSRQREALVLRYFADLPEQETALAMGVSLGTVKSTTSRALAALGRMLQEEL